MRKVILPGIRIVHKKCTWKIVISSCFRSNNLSQQIQGNICDCPVENLAFETCFSLLTSHIKITTGYRRTECTSSSSLALFRRRNWSPVISGDTDFQYFFQLSFISLWESFYQISIYSAPSYPFAVSVKRAEAKSV